MILWQGVMNQATVHTICKRSQKQGEGKEQNTEKGEKKREKNRQNDRDRIIKRRKMYQYFIAYNPLLHKHIYRANEA